MNTNTTITLLDYLPYIVSIFCSIITGIASILVARKQTKSEITKVEKQFSLEIEKEREKARLELEMEREKARLELEREREKFEMEKEKLNIEHQHQLELKESEAKNQLGSDLLSTMTKEYMRTPAAQAQMRKQAGKKRKK